MSLESNEASETLIIFNEERRAFLELKLAEYGLRLTQSEGRKTSPGTLYKSKIISKLLTDGEVDYEELKEALLSELGEIDEERYQNAFFVIKAYNEGRNNELLTREELKIITE